MLSTKHFNQTVFIHNYQCFLGQETKDASRLHDGLCQAFCIIIALKGHESFLIEALLLNSTPNPIDLIFKENGGYSNYFQERTPSYFDQLFFLLEKVAMKAHPANIMSTREKLSRGIFENVSLLGPKLFDDSASLLINDDKDYKINREMLTKVLGKSADGQYIQLTFMVKPKLLNGFKLQGHATLVFKSKGQFYFFDPNDGYHHSEDLDAVCNKIDENIKSFYQFSGKKPIIIGAIDLHAYLVLYKGDDWIRDIQDKTSEKKDEILELNKMKIRDSSETLATIMRKGYSDTNPKSKSNLLVQKDNIKRLLEFKADPNFFCTPNLETPLDFAGYAKCEAVEALLMEYGGVKNWRNLLIDEKSLDEPIKQMFVKKDYEALINLYKQCNEDYVNFKCYLHLYFIKTFHELMDMNENFGPAKNFLCKFPFELQSNLLDSRDSKGNPVLIKFIKRFPKDLENFKFLVNNFTDMTLYDPENNTALLLAVKLAVKKGYRGIITALVAKGTKENLELKDNKNKTAIAIAIENNDFDTFDFLLNHGAELYVEYVEVLKKSQKENKMAPDTLFKYIIGFRNYAILFNEVDILASLHENGYSIELDEKNIHSIIQKGSLDVLNFYIITNKLTLTDDMKPLTFVSTTIQNQQYAMAGYLLQQINIDLKTVELTIDKATLIKIIDSYILITESENIPRALKIRFLESICKQENTFGQLIARLNKEENSQKSRRATLFSSNKTDYFEIFKVVIAEEQKQLRLESAQTKGISNKKLNDTEPLLSTPDAQKITDYDLGYCVLKALP